MPRLQHDSFHQQGSTFSINWDGEAVEAVAGESIAAALTACGKLALGQDKTGAPRGIFCGMGACFDCQVSVDGGPPERACLTKVRPGMKIRSLSYRAGIQDSGAQSDSDKIEKLECDVLIVGAGAAGMSAAIRIAEAGATVVIADERSEPGGQFFKQLAPSHSFTNNKPSDNQYRDGASLIDRLNNTDALFINSATVWGTFRDDAGNMEICVTAGPKSYIVRARKLVLATGAFESVPVFPGWTLPGVMTTGAAQSLVRAYRVAPGQKVLISGNGPLNLHLAYELITAGVDVVAVAESAPEPFPRRWLAGIGAMASSPSLILRGIRYLAALRKLRVPLHYGHHILRADGDERVRFGSIAKMDRDAKLLPNTEKRYEVDTVCVGYTLHPSNELARSLGCKHEVVKPGLVVPVRDENGQSNIAGVYVIGDGSVLGGAHVAMAEGRLAAEAVLGTLSNDGSKSARHDRRALRRHRRFQRNLWSIYEAPEVAAALPDTPICRCEMVTLDTIKTLIKSGVSDMGSLKRLSRAGMGLCQGRYCQKQIALALTDMTGNIPEAEEMFAPQVPVKPTLIKNVAAEKPEWHSYRTVEMPKSRIEGKAAASLITKTNVLVIGGGIIGISTALFLAREGFEVMIVDRDIANGQASGGNAGSLHLQLMSFDFSEETSTYESPAVGALSLQTRGVDAWRNLEKNIDADFELEITGGIMLAKNKHDLEFLRKKAALERSCGIGVEILSDVDLGKLAPAVSSAMAGAAYCADEGKINPMLATPLILAEAIDSGALIMEKTAVIGIDYEDGKYVVTTDKGRISCAKIVNAAGAWTADIASMIGVTLPVKTAPLQMIVTEAVDPVVKHLMALAKTHLTMKQATNGNIIIGGGWYAGYDSASNRAATFRESIEGNLWAAQQAIRQIGLLQMIRSWATIGVMIDGAPILGELPGHAGFFNAVGVNGYTMGPFLGQITAELIRSGQRITDIQPFSVDRFN